MFRKSGKDAVILKENIDQPYITQLEQRNEHLKFARIDSELADEFKGGEVAAQTMGVQPKEAIEQMLK